MHTGRPLKRKSQDRAHRDKACATAADLLRALSSNSPPLSCPHSRVSALLLPLSLTLYPLLSLLIPYSAISTTNPHHVHFSL
jgi:hypothetical protein